MRVSPKFVALSGGLWAAAAIPGFAQITPDGFSNLQNVPQMLNVQFQPGGSYLGIRLADIDADRANTLRLPEPRGVEITGVQPGSPAAEAGLKPGDVVLTYNGENVLGAQHLGRLVSETPPGRKIRVQYWRDGKEESTVITTRAPEMPGMANAATAFMAGNVRFPETRTLALMDVPNPIMVWKNSMLGIWCEPIDSQLAEYFGVKRGVLVRSVDKESPAEKAGVKAGDVLTSIGDRHVGAPRDITSYIRSQRQDTHSVTIELVREHKPLTLHITMTENGQQ